MKTNKVILNGETLIDVTDVGTTAENVAYGVRFIGADGEKGQGELTAGLGTSVGELLTQGGRCEHFQGTEIDIIGADTSNRTDFNQLFYMCSNLQSIPVEYLDTTNAIYMSAMFADCYSITDLDLTGFDTSNVLTFNQMLNNCNSLQFVDVSGFDTSKATTFDGMFANCGALEDVDVSGFNTSNATQFGSMFSGCSSLQSINVSNFDTSKGENFGYMFTSCNNIITLDVSNFDTSNAGNLDGMFNGMSSLETLKLPARFNEVESDLGLQYDTSLVEILVPDVAYSYYTDDTAVEHNGYFTSNSDLVNKIVTYTPPTTTYTFDTTGGTSVSSITTSGYLTSQSTTPTNPDYVFKGWYFDSSFTKKVKFPYLNLNANNTSITLYAKYGEVEPVDASTAINLNTDYPNFESNDYVISYDITSDYQPVNTGNWPQSPRVWLKFTTGNNGAGYIFDISDQGDNPSSIVYTVLNDTLNTTYADDYYGNSAYLPSQTTFYVAVGFDNSSVEGTINFGFTIIPQ